MRDLLDVPVALVSLVAEDRRSTHRRQSANRHLPDDRLRAALVDSARSRAADIALLLIRLSPADPAEGG